MFRLRGRRLAINAYSRLVTGARVDIRRTAALGPDYGILLNLHSISPDTRSLASPLSPEAFKALAGWLARHFRVTTVRGIASSSNDDRRPFAVLSFDDGYRDFLDYAMPILDSYGLRANQNIVPGCVESGRPPWNVRLLDILGNLPAQRLKEIRLPGLVAAPPGADRESRVRFGVALSRFLKLRSRAEREPLIDELNAQLGPFSEAPTTPMLSSREVLEAARHHELGLHSYEHDSMEFESDDFFRSDIARSFDWAARHFTATPLVYAFPNGSHRESQIRIALESGFRDVLLVGEMPSRVRVNVHPRIPVYGTNAREVRTRIAHACGAAERGSPA